MGVVNVTWGNPTLQGEFLGRTFKATVRFRGPNHLVDIMVRGKPDLIADGAGRTIDSVHRTIRQALLDSHLGVR